MSVLVGAARPQNIVTQSDNTLLSHEWEDDYLPIPIVSLMRPIDQAGGFVVEPWLSDWWPRGGGLAGDSGIVTQATRWALTDYRSGVNARLVIAGITRDATGTVLPNATIRLIRTGNHEVISQGTSDTNGFFSLTTPYYETHFVTVHATGVGGATISSLFPT